MAEVLPLARRAGLALPEFAEAVQTGTGQRPVGWGAQSAAEPRSWGFSQWAPHVMRRAPEPCLA